MSDDNKNETIEDFLGQMAEYIKSTFPKPTEGEGGEGKTPPPPEVKKDEETPKPKKRHFWFGELDD